MDRASTPLREQQLRDQFDNLEKHTQWGIEYVEKYTKFVKERSEIETSYAKQIRNLSKKYQPKKNSREEDESKYTFCRAFLTSLNELNDYAGQHEVIAENLTSQIITDLSRFLQDLKAERKSHFHDGRKAQQHIESSWKQLESCKRKFERDCKEADRAQQYFERMDADINVTKADVEKRSSHKARQHAQSRQQMAADSKSDYSSYLQKFNQDQSEHYFTIIPNIFQKLQDMEEKRIDRIGVCMKTFAEVDRQVLPIVGKCLDGMTKAAESIDSKTDSKQVVESFKSGFEPPGDVEFEDYGQAMKRTVSNTSLTSSREAKDKPVGKSKVKLWPFKNKNKLMSLLTSPRQPPPAPPSSSPPSPSAVPNDPQSPKQHKEPLSHRLNDFMTSKPKMHCLRSLRRGVSVACCMCACVCVLLLNAVWAKQCKRLRGVIIEQVTSLCSCTCTYVSSGGQRCGNIYEQQQQQQQLHSHGVHVLLLHASVAQNHHPVLPAFSPSPPSLHIDSVHKMTTPPPPPSSLFFDGNERDA
ncbi:formin-binding protein 1 isoform X7 [Gasterosteus aculeatus]